MGGSGRDPDAGPGSREAPPDEAPRLHPRLPDLLFSERPLAPEFKTPFLPHDLTQVSGEVVVAYGKPEEVADDIRLLRNEISLRWLEAEGAVDKSLAIVSPGRQEGRTFIASNLAVAFSQVGKHVLLIDADMRRGRIHELFGLTNTGGLSLILSGQPEADGLFTIPGLPGLTVIPSGPRPPNPSDLLAMPCLRTLLDMARQSFDLVILDTPDWRQSPDVAPIAAASRGVVMTTRLGRSKLRHVRAMRTSLQKIGVSTAASLVMEF
jgi:receptor protein-tyrosine kinase